MDPEPARRRIGDSPVAQAVAAAGVVDLEKLVGLWPAVVDQVRQGGSELLGHVFAAARPVAVNVEEAVVDIGFPASKAFNKRKAEASEARERLAEAVRTIAGERLRPVFVLLDSDDDEEEAAAEPTMSEDDLVELMRAEFDAEIVSGPDDGKTAEDLDEAKEA